MCAPSIVQGTLPYLRLVARMRFYPPSHNIMASFILRLTPPTSIIDNIIDSRQQSSITVNEQLLVHLSYSTKVGIGSLT